MPKASWKPRVARHVLPGPGWSFLSPGDRALAVCRRTCRSTWPRHLSALRSCSRRRRSRAARRAEAHALRPRGERAPGVSAGRRSGSAMRCQAPCVAQLRPARCAACSARRRARTHVVLGAVFLDAAYALLRRGWGAEGRSAARLEALRSALPSRRRVPRGRGARMAHSGVTIAQPRAPHGVQCFAAASCASSAIPQGGVRRGRSPRRAHMQADATTPSEVRSRLRLRGCAACSTEMLCRHADLWLG